MLGAFEGAIDGATEGAIEGANDGTILGAILGAKEGANEGACCAYDNIYTYLFNDIILMQIDEIRKHNNTRVYILFMISNIHLMVILTVRLMV